MSKPKRTKTQRRLAGWKFLNGFMVTSKYVVAELPATIMVIIKHNDWFPSVTQTVSVSTGFSMFCLTILISIICMAKKEETFKKVSPFIVAASYLIVFGVVALFLASILSDFGFLLLFTGVGMAVAVIEDTVQRNVIKKRVEYWSGVLSDAGLNEQENNDKAKKAADVKRAKEEAKLQEQAIE